MAQIRMAPSAERLAGSRSSGIGVGYGEEGLLGKHQSAGDFQLTAIWIQIGTEEATAHVILLA